MIQLLRNLVIALALAALLVTAKATEATWDYAVQVTAGVESAPARITLRWVQQSEGVPASYTVFRKAVGSTSWGKGTKVAGDVLEFVDDTVAVGTAYEYQVVRAANGFAAFGYVQAGIDIPLNDRRGKLVLIVDDTHASALTAELARLENDLVGDGWLVLRHDVARGDSVAKVKSLIKADYDADPAAVRAVFLFGHVPVPYSGELNPDGHPDHVGAWPADVFYGDMDGSWTDSSTNYAQSLNADPVDAARLTNVPGDGKFDQSALPSAIELQVGRVDLSNMPGRSGANSPGSFASELELLRQYLHKDHAYRHRSVYVPRRAIVGDYFGVRRGEAFAASGYRNFAPLVGSDQITNLNRQYDNRSGVAVPALVANDYLFAYGCGAGSYRTVAGFGTLGHYNDSDTVEMVTNDVRATFLLLYGSWFGDWDHEDSFLRAPLATKTNGLVSVWSGRPHWFIHPMGLGETVGAATRLTQNNAGLYRNQVLTSANRIHAALMGDPSLRLYPVAPPTSVEGTVATDGTTVRWSSSPDDVLGYHVYRAGSASGDFVRLTDTLQTTTSFVDRDAPAGAVYMVRAVKREISPSGSFFNPSQGVFWRSDVSLAANSPRAAAVKSPMSPVAPQPEELATPFSAGVSLAPPALSLAGFQAVGERSLSRPGHD